MTALHTHRHPQGNPTDAVTSDSALAQSGLSRQESFNLPFVHAHQEARLVRRGDWSLYCFQSF